MQRIIVNASLLALLSVGGCIAASGGGGSANDFDDADVSGAIFRVDDFESEASRLGTAWETSVDQGDLGTRARFDFVRGGAVTKDTAGRFSGYLGKNQAPWPWATAALNFKVDYTPVDISAVTGLRFWVKGDGKSYKLKLDKAAATDWAQYEVEFVAPSEWTEIVVPIDSLEQPSWGKPIPKVFDDSRQIQLAPTLPDAEFELFIDDVSLVVAPDKVATFPFDIVRDEPVPEAPASEIAKRAGPFHPVPLASVANMAFQDKVAGDGRGGWTDQGENSMYGFPTGRQTFLGIPFEIPDGARQALVLRGKGHDLFPKSATIPVGHKGKALYFLHANAWGDLKNGRYVVHYADGSKHIIALRTGHEIFDFWTPDASTSARTGWSGSNPKRERVGLTLFAWRNPKPGVTIERITAETPGDGAYLMLGGLTVASGGPYLPPAPAIRFDLDDWFPYDGIKVAERRGTALDMSRLLDAPAGKHGVLKREGEDFVFADDTPVRFWGMSISDLGNAPTHEQAKFMAEFIAQLGVNMIRHHLMDAHWSTGSNIFRGKSDTRELDPAYMDRFDYFVAELQKRGIYQNFDFIAQRKPFASDGIENAEDVQPGYKMIGEFDAQAIQLQERFIKQLMGHENKYTGRTYATDPAVVMTTVTNESTLFFLGDWGQGQLESAHHRKLLQTRYNQWLAQRIGDRRALEARWTPQANESGKLGLDAAEDPARGTVLHIPDFSDRTRAYGKYSQARVRDNYRFIYDIETSFHERMKGVIRRTGYKGLITGTNHWLDVPIHQYVNAATDWNDTHVYWAHPSTGYQYKAGTTFEAQPAVKVANSLISRIAARRVKGMPHLISEWNSCHPLWRNDAQLMMAAYSGLHNWSALQYTITSKPFSEGQQAGARLDNVFDMTFQGGILGLWPATANMVLRKHVQEASDGHYRPWSHAEVFDPASRVGLPDGLAYVAKAGMAFVGDKTVRPDWDRALAEFVTQSSARSTTGQLFTDWKRGIFTVDTPKSQAIVGFTGNQTTAVSHLSVKLENEFVTVIATSLDELPLAQSRRVLITAVGNAVNTGMEIAPSGASFRKGGRAPIMIEPMLGKIELRGLTGDLGAAKVYYLSTSGRRRGTVKATPSGSSLAFDAAARYRTMHYELVR